MCTFLKKHNKEGVSKKSVNPDFLDSPLLWINIAWQRPTLAGALAPTTIGAGELNFRVRDGNGCDLSAIVTRPTTLILLPAGLYRGIYHPRIS